MLSAKSPSAVFGNKPPVYQARVLAPKRSHYLVAVCFYNEGERLARQLRKINSLAPREFDLLLSDDGSNDGEPRLEGVRVSLRLPGNMGLSTSIRAVLDWVAREDRYEGLILMNGNDKDDPEAIPRFIAALCKGYDYVQGSRFLPGGSADGTPLSRYLAIRLVHSPIFSLAARRYVSDTTNGFRAFSARFLGDPSLHAQQDSFRHYELEPYLAWKAIRMGYRWCEIPVRRTYPRCVPMRSLTKIHSPRMHAKLLWPVLRLLAKPYP